MTPKFQPVRQNEDTCDKLENSLMVAHQNPHKNLKCLQGHTVPLLLYRHVTHVGVSQVKSFRWLTYLKQHVRNNPRHSNFRLLRETIKIVLERFPL